MVVISTDALLNIDSFYKSFASQHRYDYTITMMLENINQVIDGVNAIDVNRSRVPILSRHQKLGYREFPFIRKRGTKYDWYAEYKEEVDDNGNQIIHVYEVLHRSQMHESHNKMGKVVISESRLKRIIKESIRKVLYN